MWTAWVEFYMRFSSTFTPKPLSTQIEPFNENFMTKKPTTALINERKLCIFQMRTLEQRFILAYKFFRVDPCTVAINWQPNRFTHRRTNYRYISTYTDVYKWNIGYFAIASLVWMKFSMKMGYTKRSNLRARVGFQWCAVRIRCVFNSQAFQLLYWQEWKIIQEFNDNNNNKKEHDEFVYFSIHNQIEWHEISIRWSN